MIEASRITHLDTRTGQAQSAGLGWQSRALGAGRGERSAVGISSKYFPVGISGAFVFASLAGQEFFQSLAALLVWKKRGFNVKGLLIRRHPEQPVLRSTSCSAARHA